MDSAPPTSSPALVVSLHDAHPGSLGRIRDQVEALYRWGVDHTSILVVPEWHHGPPTAKNAGAVEQFTQWQADGHELVLHGYYHDRQGQVTTAGNLFWTKLYTNSEAEFLDLERELAAERIRKGRALFGRLGWRCDGFIAPAWLMARHVPATLRNQHFAYTNTLRSFHNFARSREVATQSLCWSTRALWRRQCSVGWNAHLLNRLLRQRPELLRISLHPDDLTYPPIARQVEDCLKRALQSGYKPTTYAEYAEG